MNIDFTNLKKNILVAEAFAVKYSDFPHGYLTLNFNMKPCLYLEAKECAETGEFFGKIGWTRTPNSSGTKFNWEMDVDGVRLHISECEDNVTLNSPVPPQAFPLLLK